MSPAEITGVGPTWQANVVDGGDADCRRAASVSRQSRDDIEPMFEAVDEP